MVQAGMLWLYLDADTLADVRAGRHNFFGRLIGAVRGRGWEVRLRPDTLAERLAAPTRQGQALFHMAAPTHPGALTCRRAYLGAFWRIEADAARWNWPVAKAAFRSDPAQAGAARKFADRLRRRMGGGRRPETDRGGFVFVPLQGRLLERRSFQAASPVEMLRATLAQTDLPLRTTLHPRESYSAREMAALRDLVTAQPRLTLEAGGSEALLAACDLVVTQNSGLAFQGYALHKPAVLFAGADFHHIAGSVPHLGVAAAFARARGPAPDFDGYLHWFLAQKAINAGRDDCEDRILTVMHGHGWPL